MSAIKLNLPDRVRALKAAVTGQWEGHERDRRRNRPPVRLVSQDTDLNYGDREKLIAEARALCQVFGIPKRILRQYANYCVGDCQAKFNTSDDDWNDLAEANWRMWCKMADVNGIHDFRSLVRLAIMSMIRDGDCLFILVDNKGWPQLQAIEADRLGNTKGVYNIDENRLIGGIGISASGRPQFYRILERNRYGTFINPRDIPSREIVHLYDPDRIDAYRGVTHFHAALNHLRDLKEIIAAEKTAVKVNSKLAIFWQSISGGAITSANGSGFNPFGTDNTESATGGITTEEINDGAIAYGFPNETAKSHTSDRPSAAWQGFIELLVQDIAIGLELPKAFVWSMAGLTGPATRMESKQAERTFNGKMDILESRLLNRVCGWVTAKSIKEGRLPFHPEWYVYGWQRPSHPSIDVGRESSANINEHRRGLMTGSEVAAERGKDIYDVIDQKGREAKYAMKVAERNGVPLGMIMDFSGPMTISAAQDSEDSEETSEPKSNEDE